MSNSLQKWVGRNRPPRVQITYDVEIGDAVEKRELPLVVGLLADGAGTSKRGKEITPEDAEQTCDAERARRLLRGADAQR